MTSVSKAFFTVSSCTVAVTEFMDVTWSYITDSLQNVNSVKISKNLVVQGQGQGLLNWSSRILDDKDFAKCHCNTHTALNLNFSSHQTFRSSVRLWCGQHLFAQHPTDENVATALKMALAALKNERFIACFKYRTWGLWRRSHVAQRD